MLKKIFLLSCGIILAVVPLAWNEVAAKSSPPANTSPDGDPIAQFAVSEPLSLDQCIQIALRQNQKRRISRLAVETAELQLKQAFSSFWPTLNFETGYNQFDENINFIFPQETANLTIPMPPAPPLQGTITVPEKEIKVIDRESVLSRLQVNYPIFTGGLRTSTVKAAKAGVKAAQSAMRRTDLELIRDVQRMYYGVVLARKLARIGAQTFNRLEVTTDLTEKLYKQGAAGTVTKLDYLRSKVVLESVRSVKTTLDAGVELTEAALGNTMGLNWQQPVKLAETELPFHPVKVDLDKLVAETYRFNPDWQRLAAGLEAANALVRKEQAGHWPKIGLSGMLWRWDNDLGSGMATKENQSGWSVGAGLRLPIFDGFLTTNRVKQAKVRVDKMASQQILLKEGLALQVKHGFIRMQRAHKVYDSSQQAMRDAREHRELAVRAYMSELTTTEIVIESQIFEALTRARAVMSAYDHISARYDIDFIVGREVKKMLDAAI